jgi:hypothetical protein
MQHEHLCYQGPLVNGERRRFPRYQFIATAEMTCKGSSLVIAARLGDLSLNGCYLDMCNPPPNGTLMTVRIVVGSTVFQSRGKVVYSHANLGAGVQFDNIEPRYLTVLEGWIQEARTRDTVSTARTPEP